MNHDAVSVQLCLSSGLSEEQAEVLLQRLKGPLHDAQRQLAALKEDYRDLESKLAAVGAGGVSLMGDDRPDAERWRKTLPRVRMTTTGRVTTFFVRANAVDPTKDCSVADHFKAAIDAEGDAA